MSPTTRAIFFFSWASRPRTRAGTPSADQDDARAAEHPVDGVHLLGAGDAGGDPPVAAHALEDPRGGAGLALDLAVGRALRAPAEDDQRGEAAA